MTRLELPFPPSVNSAYANNKHGRHKTLRYKNWEALAGLRVKDSHRVGHGLYSLSVCLRAPDKRRRDIGNYEKCLSDFLVNHGIVKDDSFCQRLLMTWDAGMSPECVVIIQDFEPGIAI